MKTKTQKISIAVPCYNEEELIEDTYAKIKKEAEKLPGKNYEIIFANDGSKDKTLDILKKIAARDKKVRVLSHYPNKGMGYSHRQLYNHATGEITIILDADLSTSPNIIFPLIKTLNQENLDMVIASRYAGVQGEIPISRDIPSWCYYFMNRILFGLKVRDSQSGFVAFKSPVIKSLGLTSDRFEIHMEVLGKMQKRGYKIKEIPAEYIARIEGSKFNVLTDGPKTVLRTIKVWWNLRGFK
ncbi:MAG: glycosyltransferase family 2 protein [Nanoarchaeota archaeon]|nr:glycosyltransferase family 2 protein [Nanoarchaeota archaeon]